MGTERANRGGFSPAPLKRLTITLVAIILSALALVLPYALPDKQVPLSLEDIGSYSLYDHSVSSPADSANIDDGQWVCNVFSVSASTSCGLYFMWSEEGKTVDFSKYHQLRLDLNYQGPTNRVAIYLVNDSLINGSTMDKMNAVFIRGTEVDGEISIDLDEFKIAEWWVDQYNVSRSEAHVELDSVSALEISFGSDVQPGEHVYKLEGATLVGEWVKPEMVLFSVLLAWVAAALFDVFNRMTSLSLRADKYRRKLGSVSQEKDKYRRMSETDNLTGVLNRAGFESKVEDIVDEKSSLDGHSLYIFDIDHYKRVNDQRGHTVGDRVLEEFASVISSRLRQRDIFARWGGDEFVLLADGMDAEAAVVFANQLLAQISEHRFFGVKELRISASVGVTTIADRQDFEQAFRCADQALFKAKKRGRNRCASAEDSDEAMLTG